MKNTSRWHAVIVLLGIAAIWGFTAPIIKDATDGFPVSLFLLLRFGVALIALTLVSWRALLSRALWSRPNHKWLALACVAGLADFAGYATQTAGLQTTTPGKAAFITGLSVVLVPVILTLMRQRQHKGGLWMPVALGVIGLACLMGQGLSFEFFVGDAWVLLSAFAFAVQIVLISLLPKHMDVLALAAIQIGACLLGAGALVLADQPLMPIVPAATLSAVMFLGLVATAITLVAQTWAQRGVPANETALIFCTEPAWGALAGVLLAGEQFTAVGMLGCALMLLGMAWPELRALAATRGWLSTPGLNEKGDMRMTRLTD